MTFHSSSFNRLVHAAMFLLLMALVPALASTEPASTAEPATPVTSDSEDWRSLSAFDLAERALIDTLYYNFDDWFVRFKHRIEELEAQPRTKENQLELMKFYFYMAGLNGELTHTLAFSSKFKVDKVKQDFQHYIEKAKDIAGDLLENPDLSKQDRADTYFFLGASEGYVGMLDYGAGNLLSALVNGLSADNHLEDALELDPDHADAHVGLGVYRYGNTRLGGLGNFIMQGGQDLRKVGLGHIERALQSKIMSRPLALKTLIWFYISEQINPENADLPKEDPLSRPVCRKRALVLIAEYENSYFKNMPDHFPGNKGLVMMKAIQNVLDADYMMGHKYFRKALEISNYLRHDKGMPLNPQYIDTVTAAMEFCELMLMAQTMTTKAVENRVCAKINGQIEFIENGGSMIEYESSKIRREIQDVFYDQLKGQSREHQCG